MGAGRRASGWADAAPGALAPEPDPRRSTWLWPSGIWARLALCLLAAMAPLLVLLFTAISAERSRVIQNAEWQANEAARLGAEQQQAMLQNTAGLLRVLAGVPTVQDAGPPCGEFLRSVAAGVPNVVSILVTDASGVTRCSSRPAGVGLSHAERSYFQEAVRLEAGSGYALSELVRSRVDGRPIVFIAVPIEAKAGELRRGTLIAALQLGWFSALREHVDMGENTVVQVLDSRDGAVIARVPDPQRLTGLRFPDHPVIRAFRAAPTAGLANDRGIDGEDRIFAYAPLPGRNAGLVIAVGLSSEALHQEARRKMLLAMGFGLGVTALAVLLSWRIAQVHLVQPLRAMAAAAAQLGSGDMSSSAEISESAPWEIRALAGTFRRMVMRLQMRDRRIEAMQLELAASEEHHRLLADSANDMITRFSSELKRLYVSPACRDLLGYEPDELVGRKPGNIVHPDDWEALDASLNQALLAGCATARATYRAFRKDGSQLWVESSGRSLGHGAGFVVVTRDVTERKVLEQRLAAANEQLSVLARQDALTGLANRRRFDEALHDQLRKSARDGTPLAVLLLDVDRFKAFNDTYGHPVGDACLQRVAAALTASLRRAQDLAARYGGEEFAVVLPDADLDGGIEVALAIQTALAAAAVPHEGAVEGRVTSSIGIAALLPGQRATASDLLRLADAALYRAKREGRNRVCCSPGQLGTTVHALSSMDRSYAIPGA